MQLQTWPAEPLDRFVLSRLEQKDLQPAPPADRHTLIRRAYFDLIGLPPTAEKVQQFIHDPSPQAWTNVVDGLLASPQFGERWARHWLDLVRYAETRGHEFDFDVPHAWQYRDYVIRAFNADVPYNQFVTEQIAGDLLEQPRTDPTGATNESVLGTGFWFLGDWVHSPVDIRLDETDRVDNQIDVMGKTFLGLTLGCARCHDHKFDAISAKDYYSLAGFLNSSSYREVHFQGQAHNRQIAAKLAAFDKANRHGDRQGNAGSGAEFARPLGELLECSGRFVGSDSPGPARLAGRGRTNSPPCCKRSSRRGSIEVLD